MKRQNYKNNVELLNDWLSSLKLNDEKNPALKDIHIDELIGKKDNKTYFFKSLEIFYDLIHLDFDYNFRMHYIPFLRFRLGFAEKLLLKVSTTVWDEFDGTPPNIYLAPKMDYLTGVDIEQYKKPLDFEAFKDFQKDCVVYYSCWRSIDEIQNNWEYVRDIYIENFGKKMCMDKAPRLDDQ